MFSTKSVQSLKNLFASYHEPLPLSKQQSQKLLDGLKASFRSQLDREYGHLSNSPNSISNAAESYEHTRQSATNRHLKDILSNPLFSYNKDTTSTLPSSLATPQRDPMRVFDHAVARGMMTPKAATGCMLAKRQQLQSENRAGAMASSQTAPRIIQWLRSTGSEKDLRFLDNQPFVRALLPFLVAEGMEEVVWEWLARTVNDTSGVLDADKQLKRSSRLLSDLVRTKCQPENGNLDAAITTMLQAQQMFKESPMLSELLVLSWRAVSWFSTVEAYSRTAPSEELFDAHLATADRLPKPFLMERAHLHLHHPTHPDHMPALQFFRNKEKLRNYVHNIGVKKAKPAKLSAVPWLAFLGHDTVHHLSQSGRTQEAQDVIEFLQSEVTNLFSGGQMRPA